MSASIKTAIPGLLGTVQGPGASKSAWRFVKAAFAMSAPKPAFRHVLITLASFADENGVCFPSHNRLLQDTGYSTKTTIVSALAFWKKVGVLTWEKGWGNSFARRSNRYRFNHEAMVALAKNNHSKVDEQALAPEEETLGPDEQPVRADEQPPEDERTNAAPTSKVLCIEDLNNKNGSGIGRERPAPLIEELTASQYAHATQVQDAEETHSGHSPEQPPSSSSSPLRLADLFAQLAPENQKLWYRRTGGDPGQEGVRIAHEILSIQGGK